MTDFNLYIFYLLNNLAGKSPVLDGLFIFLSKYLPYILVAIFVIAVMRLGTSSNRHKAFLSTGFALLFGIGIVIPLIHWLYPTVRPFAELSVVTQIIPETGNSFPSIHTTIFFILSTILFRFNRRFGIIFIVLGSTMALARVFVGVHYPIDILGGAVLGVTLGYLATRISRVINLQDRKPVI